MTSKPSRAAYRGTDLGLVISIDLGTTFSGTSWAFLDPNQVPQVYDVTGFEGQEFQATSTKVPTVMYYDQNGNLKAVGSQTTDPQTIIEPQWTRVAWFKLLLRPGHLQDELEDAPEATIPSGKTLVDVISDFLEYMAKLARDHFLEKMDGSGTIWPKVEGQIQYVLSHPNGWNTFQHTRMRDAAIQGGLVPDTDDGRSRIHFVSEGEASLHWCMGEGLGRKNLNVGGKFVVVDAGGGTIDVSSFEVTSLGPLQLKELSVPECRLAGSVYVNRAFEKFLQEKLVSGGSVYSDPENLERMVEDFDKKAKCTFRRTDRKTIVSFGSSRENEPEFGIASGRVIIEGPQVAEFFEKSCNAAATAVRAQVTRRNKTTILLVGGFAASPWLLSELQRRLTGLNVEIMRADGATAKAAANGAVSFYLDHFVSARVAKWTYGVFCARSFDSNDPSHVKRRWRSYQDPISDTEFVPGAFTVHLTKGTVVHETEKIRFPFVEDVATQQLVTLDLDLQSYRGEKLGIQWVDEDDSDLFRKLCSFQATIPRSCFQRMNKGTGIRPRNPNNALARHRLQTQHFWRCEFDVVVSFGTAEFKCYIEWKDEAGCLQRGPATPVWDEG